MSEKITAKVSVPLNADEASALVVLAREDCRHPREQLRWLLRQEAIRRGYFSGTLLVPASDKEVPS